MATQVHVALADRVDGAGLIASGPYGCAEGDVQTALGPCIDGTGLDTDALAIRALDRWPDLKGNMAGDRVYLFHGRQDDVVRETVVRSAGAFYEALLPVASIAERFDVAAPHGLPTESSGAECSKFESPYVNACDFDLAGEMLQHLLGDLDSGQAVATHLYPFDQTAFGERSLWDTGYVYIPSRCRGEGSCAVHVFFHGCQQSAERLGDAVPRLAGLNDWAEANDLIVLYPQIRHSNLMPLNPLGCWDWWGYSGPGYDREAGPQIAAILAMIDRLAEAG